MLITLSNNFLQLTVKGAGAEMQQLKSVANNQEYLWQGDSAFWGRRAPVLFPIVGKVYDQKYRVNNQKFSLSQHGFARDQDFEIVQATKTDVVFSISDSQSTLQVYPFRFKLLISYELVNNKVIVTYEVQNTDQQEVIFAIGGHPGFQLDSQSGDLLNDYYLEFEQAENAERHLLKDGCFSGATENVLNNTNILPLNYELFQKDAIVFKDLKSTTVSLKSYTRPYYLKFDFQGWPFLGIWTPKQNAPFVCIEPWQGIADNDGYEGEFKDKEGIVVLPKGETFRKSYTIEIVSALN
jgi:galactose mutarotase-like enzyme